MTSREQLNVDPEIQQILDSAFSTTPSLLPSSSVNCCICSLNLDFLTVSERQEHCNQHLESSQPPPFQTVGESASGRSARSDTAKLSFAKPWYTSKSSNNVTEWPNDFWHYTSPTPPPSNYTPGLVNLLKKALWTAHARGTTQRAVLCYERCVHISRKIQDVGWGCGYRNFLMACAALMEQETQPAYPNLLREPLPPGVLNLQICVEEAWGMGKLTMRLPLNGFDKQGAKQLQPLVGEKKWIGTSDLCVAFTYRGIPAELVDFNLENQPRGISVVVDWIVDHFSPKPSTSTSYSVNEALRGASPIITTNRMPVILQDKGHSRTIVGYEVAKNGQVTLLTFDPSTVLGKEQRKMALLLWSQSTASVPGEISCKTRKRPFSGVDYAINVDQKDSVPSQAMQDKARKPPSPKDDLQGQGLRHLLDKFRLNPKKLRKKEYQILYFPMTEPLTEKDKMKRKIVISTKVC